MRRISNVEFDGRMIRLPNGMLVLSQLGERLKGRNRNKIYQQPDGVLVKYKDHVKKQDEQTMVAIKRIKRKYIKTLIKKARKEANDKRATARK